MPVWMTVVGIVEFVHGLSLVSYVLFGYFLVQPHFLSTQLVVPTALIGFGLLFAALRIRLQERILWHVGLVGLAWSALIAGIVIVNRLSRSSGTVSLPEVISPIAFATLTILSSVLATVLLVQQRATFRG